MKVKKLQTQRRGDTETKGRGQATNGVTIVALVSIPPCLWVRAPQPLAVAW